MVDLNGHEAGNGGHSQGKPTAYRDSSTRREAIYRVQVFNGPEAGVKYFPNLKAALAHREWLRKNNIADHNIRIVCTSL